MLEGAQPGGQLTIPTDVENSPGFREGVQGPALMEELRAQALRLGADLAAETVLEVDLGRRPFQLVSDLCTYTCDALIIATGASAKWHGVGKNEELAIGRDLRVAYRASRTLPPLACDFLALMSRRFLWVAA